jgi:MEMO1 family protein
MEYPKIRSLSVFPIESAEGQSICLQDPYRYLEYPVMISPETFSVIQFFDGQHSFQDIQQAYKQRYGVLLLTEQIEQLAEQLDVHFLLESPRFFNHLRALHADFARLTVRPSSHQGSAYAADQEGLTRQLESYFTAVNGPGQLPIPCPDASDSRHGQVKAIMAPHIDLSAGGPTFAWAYHALAASEADLFIILGTAHVEMQNFLALTAKRFQTPFGAIETDQEFVAELACDLPYDGFADEFIHKNEHSIEFQVLFLQYLFARKPIKIVPILCGGQMHEALAHNQPLAETPQLEESITSLKRLFQAHPRACVIASVDFSHVGLRYGDETEPTAETLKKVEQVDRHLLSTLARVTPDEFVAQLQRHRNATQVCGVVPMYTLLRLMDGAHGSLLHYNRAETGPGSIVTFASMVWER